MTATAEEVSNFWKHHANGETVRALLCLTTYPELVALECSESVVTNTANAEERRTAANLPLQEVAYTGELAVQAS